MEFRFGNLRLNKVVTGLFILCLLIEILVCNANSFHVWNRDRYERKTYTVDQMETSGFEVTGNILTYVADYGEEASITLKGIGTEIGTLYMDLYLPNESYLAYTLYYTDEANSSLMRSVQGEYVPEVERTKWMTCHFSGKSDELKIVFNLQDDLYQMAVDGFVINEPVKFQFCLWRFALMLLIVCGAWALRNLTYFNGGLCRRSQAVLLGIVYLFCVFVLWNLYANSVPEAGIWDEKGDLYSQNLTDALISGRTELEPEPSERFQQLDNPYDYTEREAAGLERDVDYLWDAAYYQGHHYAYFGVMPALLLFVPWKLMTGMYLSTGFVVFLFFCVYLLFLDLLFVNCIRKLLPDTSYGLYVLGEILLNAASGAACFVSRARFYEMAYATGLAFTVLGLWLLFSCMEKVNVGRYVRIMAGGLCLALAVGCRPTMVVYSFLLAPFLWRVLYKKPLKEKGVMILALGLPYFVVAVILMRYNYVRFGNVFNFGQNYQLTVTDMSKNSYNLATLPWCLWLGMFQPLQIIAEFPFVFSGNAVNSFCGYLYYGAMVVPMFSGVPVLYTMFAPTLWKKWRERTGRFSSIALGMAVCIGWFMAVLIFVSAGVHLRYTAEAVPILTFVSVLLVCNYIDIQNGKIKKNLISAFGASVVFSALVAFLMGMTGEQDWIFVNHPEFYYAVERAFCFWK